MYNILVIWSIINAGSIYVIAIGSAYEARNEFSNIFFFPLLISSLREKLNKIGTVIAVAFISLFFAPAIISYFIALGLMVLLCLFGKGFVKLFKRKDT